MAGTPLSVHCSSSRTYCQCHFPTYQYMSSMHSLAACDWVHMPTVLLWLSVHAYNKVPQSYLKHSGSFTKKAKFAKTTF